MSISRTLVSTRRATYEEALPHLYPCEREQAREVCACGGKSARHPVAREYPSVEHRKRRKRGEEERLTINSFSDSSRLFLDFSIVCSE